MCRIKKKNSVGHSVSQCLLCGDAVCRNGARGRLPKYCTSCRRLSRNGSEKTRRKRNAAEGYRLTCRQCGSQWTARSPVAKFCSRRCQYLQSGHIVVVACKACDKPFDVKAADLQKGRKYCTRSCMRKHLRSEERECKNCGATFRRHRSNRDSLLYCTKACYFDAKRAGRVPVLHNPNGSWHRGGRYASSPSALFARKLPGLLERGLRELFRASNQIARSSLCEFCGELCDSSLGAFCSRRCAKQAEVAHECRKCGSSFVKSAASKRSLCKRCRRGSKNRLAGNNRKRCRKYGVPYDPSLSSRTVFEMDRYVCYICKRKTDPSLGRLHPRYPTVDHVVPLSAGIYGHVAGNVRCACSECNTKKGTRWDNQLLLLAEMRPDRH
jgi:hypothetical protein